MQQAVTSGNLVPVCKPLMHEISVGYSAEVRLASSSPWLQSVVAGADRIPHGPCLPGVWCGLTNCVGKYTPRLTPNDRSFIGTGKTLS